MKIKYCKNPDCNKVIRNRRADAQFCSIRCGYNYRNKMKLDKEIMSNWESVYSTIIILMDKGIYKMKHNEFSKLNLRISESKSHYKYIPKDKLVFELFDVIIIVRNKYVELKMKEDE